MRFHVLFLSCSPGLAVSVELGDNPYDGDDSGTSRGSMCDSWGSAVTLPAEGCPGEGWVWVMEVEIFNPFYVCYQWKREQDFDFQLLEKAARDVEDREREDYDWVHAKAIHVTEMDLEPQDYDLDISREVTGPL